MQRIESDDLMQPMDRAAIRSRRSGIALALALALAAVLSSQMIERGGLLGERLALSPVLCAILLGALWRNTVGLDSRWLPGLDWVMRALLRAGIALVGLRLVWDSAGSTLLIALPVVIACILTAIVTSILVCRMFRLSQPLSLLLAAGTAVCGCTAVAALAPATRAQPAETSVALGCVVIVGCAGMVCYPWLAHLVFQGDAQAAGIFLGTAIHDTSQVLGAAVMYAQQFDAEQAAPVAALTKLIRNLSLLLLVPLFAVMSHTSAGDATGDTASRRALVLPGFLIWFVALAVARTLGDASFAQSSFAKLWSQLIGIGLTASELLLVCGMTAIGLSVSFKELHRLGVFATLAALIVALAVAACSLGMTVAMQHLQP